MFRSTYGDADTKRKALENGALKHFLQNLSISECCAAKSTRGCVQGSLTEYNARSNAPRISAFGGGHELLRCTGPLLTQSGHCEITILKKPTVPALWAGWHRLRVFNRATASGS